MTPQEHKRQKVYVAISRERASQDKEWGTTGHAVGEWLLILESELAEAKRAWVKGHGYRDMLAEVLQVATDAVACLEEHGLVEREEQAP